MKILLINPPLVSNSERGFTADEPLGLGYLASYIREKGHEVKILDTFGLRPTNVEKHNEIFIYGLGSNEIKEEIRKFKPDVVGISSMYSIHARGAHHAAKLVKEVNSDIQVVFGGSHTSVLYDWVLSDKNVDVVVKGEGEETFLEIVERLDSGKDINDVKGTVVRVDGKTKVNEPRPLLDINSIPMPARDLIPMSTYINDAGRLKMSMRPPRANVITSRGCLFNCPYCSIHAVWKNTWRGRTPEKVVDEIEHLKKEYGVREVAFMDDNISMDKERMNRLCDLMIERKLNIKWCTPNGIAVWTLDKPLLDKIKKSGCYKLTFGIETGCPETQKYIRKTHINLEKTKEIIKYCNKIGLWSHSTFVIGFPYESKDDVMKTIDWAVSTDLDMTTFWIATPMPGTDMFTDFENNGLIPKMTKGEIVNWMTNFKTEKPMWKTKQLTADQIHELRRLAHKRFYDSRKKKFLNPLRLMKKIHSFEELKYAIHLATISGEVLGELDK